MRSPVRVLLTAAALLLALGVTAPAHAERWSHRDPAGDMYQDEVGTDRDATQGDITHVRMNYTAQHFVLDVQVRELHAQHSSYLRLFFRTPQHDAVPAKTLQVDYYFSLHHGDDVEIYDTSTGYEVRCRPVKGTRSYAAGTLRITVPSGCLRRPESVRADPSFLETWRDFDTTYIATDWGLHRGIRGDDYSPPIHVG